MPSCYSAVHLTDDVPILRFKWPGYGSFNKQKHALRATQQKEAVTRAKMAVHVAEVMKDFIEVRTLTCTTHTSINLYHW